MIVSLAAATTTRCGCASSPSSSLDSNELSSDVEVSYEEDA